MDYESAYIEKCDEVERLEQENIDLRREADSNATAFNRAVVDIGRLQEECDIGRRRNSAMEETIERLKKHAEARTLVIDGAERRVRELEAEVERLAEAKEFLQKSFDTVVAQRTEFEVEVEQLQARELASAQGLAADQDERDLLEAEVERLRSSRKKALEDLEQAAEYFDAGVPKVGYGFVRNARQTLEGSE